jgi:3-hydroxyisobutyrate dehydrogenase-like beta-hydroxyacid dehydrogenase
MSAPVETVGFVGTGTMGAPMAGCLLRAGLAVVVHDARREAAAALVEAGARWADSPAEVARAARVTCTSLPGPHEVEAVLRGDDGLLAGAGEGAIHVDLSTISFAAARRFAEASAEAGVRYLDAPVSGGVWKAQSGTLAIMASGDEAAFRTAKRVLDSIGEKIFYLGPEVGAGTVAKLVNNAIFLCSGLLAQEGMVLAAKAGLDPAKLLEVLQASSASVYTSLLPMTLGRDFDDAFFTLALAAKDVALAADSADAMHVPAPVTRAAAETYHRALEGGLGAKVFFATLRAIEEAAGVELPKVG